jgi:hypothetical protein
MWAAIYDMPRCGKQDNVDTESEETFVRTKGI